LKKNITPITDGLEIVRNLQGVRYDWKDGRRGSSVGFIAQDVEKILPEVVDKGEVYAMQTSQITAVLVEAVKDQQKQIENLYKVIVLMMMMIGVLSLLFYLRVRNTLKTER